MILILLINLFTRLNLLLLLN